MARPRFEKASAKISTVRISAIEVRGTTLAWRIDSQPTKEMIASDAPYARLNGLGHAVVIWWMRKVGLKANRNPKNRIADSLMISSAPKISLNLVDSRTPRMLRVVRKTTRIVVSRIKIGWTPER